MKTTTVYIIRDATGEYLSGKYAGERTPASDEAMEYATREEAQEACERTTDRVLEREIDN